MDLPVGVEISALEVRQHPLPTVKQREVPSLRGFVLSVQRGEMMAKGVDSDRQRRNLASRRPCVCRVAAPVLDRQLPSQLLLLLPTSILDGQDSLDGIGYTHAFLDPNIVLHPIHFGRQPSPEQQVWSFMAIPGTPGRNC